MAKIFTHDCEVCKTETEQDVKLAGNKLHIKCKCCGHKETLTLQEEKEKEKGGTHKTG